MNKLKKISLRFLLLISIIAFTTACQSTSHSGCPSKDRPSYKSRYSFKTDATPNNFVVKNKVDDSI